MNNLFTGSEATRFEEIQNYWLVFEPISNSKYAIVNRLYTVPIGQTVKPEFILNTGSYTTVSGSISIEKNIHIFEDETEAAEFITDLGVSNIVSTVQRQERRGSEEFTVTEVHVLNFPEVNFNFAFRDAIYDKGFVINVFESSSILKEVFEDEVYDNKGRLVSDTYLRYFKLQSDKK